ncbi:MAG: class 1 fructose-bisphosphatase [Halobacteriaceae archaeon]
MVESIFTTVAETAPDIQSGLPGRRRQTEEENVSGETQMAADIYADELLAERLTSLAAVGAYASEEREDVVSAGTGLSVAVDPLDGSSNLKSNNPMGIIVGIYDSDLPAAGVDLVGSAFVLFGPITTMVTATAEGVTEYVIESGERNAVGSVTLPSDPTVYGFGGRVPEWTDSFTSFAREIENELKLRYGGAMIADVNQVLTYGGIFSYPGLTSRPEGKLRLQFEGAPMAYIIHQAGGRSSNGSKSLLSITPDSLHQRTPVHLGNASLIDRLEASIG